MSHTTLSPPSSAARKVACPSCGKPVAWQAENRYRPFCSERCKTMDFGAWATESYRIASSMPADPSESETFS